MTDSDSSPVDGPDVVADVLLLLPLARSYSFRVPPEMTDRVRRGAQVECPVRGRSVHGLVTEVRPRSQDDPPLSDLGGVVARPLWPEDLLDLLRWTSTYYVAPLGQVARTAMPSLFARRKPPSTSFLRFVRRPDQLGRSERAEKILSEMERAGVMELSTARSLVPGAGDVIRRLLAKGYLVIEERDGVLPVEAPRATGIPEALDLTPMQQAALDQILPSLDQGYRAFLLHGVTGSGKTEVYLRCIDAVLARGKGAIVLVPEIALTVELRRRFDLRFGNRATILHSGMPEARRARAWDEILAGRTRVVVGARSAVFAPMPDLGLIVVDEEHETTYKQQDGLRYNARDLALVRGTLARCPVLLGSATPSLESFQNAHEKKITYLSLPDRVMKRMMPIVSFVDLRYSPTAGGQRLFSTALRDALVETIGRDESAILFLNRRGFGRFLVCRTCGTSVQCPNCSITLTHHQKPDRLCCHYCDHTTLVPLACPTCNSSEVSVEGFGTERVEDEVPRLVPGARCGRLDSDTATGGGLDRILNAFRNGDINVLVGTQIVAKGHDFPRVTLVGVLLAEQSLAFPDFRSPERTFQVLTQVAGRAGRGDAPGRVIIQTYNPDQYALQFAANHDFLGFSVVENRLRRERGYPPHAYLAAVEVSSPDAVEARESADRIRDYLDQLLTTEGPQGREVTILGPSAAAIERLRGRTRLHLLLKGRKRSVMNSVLWKLYRLVGHGHGQTRIGIDVDPISLL